eukprot:gene7933-7345_t
MWTSALVATALSSCSAPAMAHQAQTQTLESQFDAWAVEHDKEYSAADRPRRMAVFAANLDRAARLSEADPSASFGANKLIPRIRNVLADSDYRT